MAHTSTVSCLESSQGYIMHAYRPRHHTPPPPADDSRIYMDLLWTAFTISVVVTVGKAIVNSAPEEIIEFVEGEKHFLGFSLLLICMSVIIIYSYLFYYHKRFEVLVDLALDYVSMAHNLILPHVSGYFRLRDLIAVFRPNPRNFVFINVVFRSVFLYLMFLFIGVSLNPFKNKEDLSVCAVVLGLYYTSPFFSSRLPFKKFITHMGYISLHLGTTLSYLKYEEKIGYILINSGVALFILCIVWGFVNVSRNKEFDRRRRW